MRTLFRHIVIVILLIVTLLVVLSTPALKLLQTTSLDVHQQSLALLGLVAILGILSAIVSFLLVPSVRPRFSHGFGRRLLYGVGIAMVFVIGWLTLGMLPWQAPGATAQQVTGAPGWALGAGWSLLWVALIGFFGSLTVSLLVGPRYTGLGHLPRSMRSSLNPDETPLCHIQQSWLKEPITPDHLLATDQRLIVYHPTNLGFTSRVENCNYYDIANVVMEQGWFFCTVSIEKRFRGEPMVYPSMPNYAATRFVRIVTEQIHAQSDHTPLSQGDLAHGGLSIPAHGTAL